MSKSAQRRYEALEYNKNKKAKLTTKQYLVYSYLMSISKWNAKDNEEHYYAYKNQFKIKDACEQLNISQPTWRNAIKKLVQDFYIEDRDTYYIINFTKPYAPLDIQLIQYLLPFGARLCSCGGGNIISVYSLLYRFWNSCQECNDDCEITINQIKKIYTSRRTKEDTITYRTMLGIFQSAGLIDMSLVTKENNGITYIAYRIKSVKLNLPFDFSISENGPDDIQHILQRIQEEEISNIELTE